MIDSDPIDQARGFLDQLKDVENDIEIGITIQEDQRKRLKTEVSYLQTKRIAEAAEFESFTEAGDKKKAKLIDEISKLETRKEAVRSELSLESDRLGDIKIESVKLSKKNNDFKTYEGKAWKVLKAKEKELLGRQEALDKRERLKPAPIGILPQR